MKTMRCIVSALLLLFPGTFCAAEEINLFEMLDRSRLDKTFCIQSPGGDGIEWKLGAVAEGKVNAFEIPLEGMSLEGFDALEIEAASSGDASGVIVLVLITPSSDSGMQQMSGYRALMPIDWRGAGKVSIEREKFEPFNSPAGLGEVKQFSMMTAGFGARIDDETATLVISSITIKR